MTRRPQCWTKRHDMIIYDRCLNWFNRFYTWRFPNDLVFISALKAAKGIDQPLAFEVWTSRMLHSLKVCLTHQIQADFVLIRTSKVHPIYRHFATVSQTWMIFFFTENHQIWYVLMVRTTVSEYSVKMLRLVYLSLYIPIWNIIPINSSQWCNKVA